jgi:SAM-dependent methyltransferase
MQNVQDQAAAFWNARSRTPMGKRTRWWQSPAIVAHINRLVCGEAIPGIHAGFNRLIDAARDGRMLRKAVSVGCGSGQKEMALMGLGFVETFHFYEISSERIRTGQQNAEKLGLADRITFTQADAFAACHDNDFDLVYWNNALHHMPDCAQALSWSHDRLRPGGLFAMDEFVGPSRFQWTDVALDFARRFRGTLNPRMLVSPADPAKPVRPIHRPTVADMIRLDPSEAADSDGILPAVRAFFPDARVILTGGAIYHTALNDVLANLDEDGPEIRQAMLLDEALSRAGQNHYAVAVAARRS